MLRLNKIVCLIVALLLVLVAGSIIYASSMEVVLIDSDDVITSDYYQDAIYSSNRYTQKDTTTLEIANPLVQITDEYEYVTTSENLALYVDKEYLGVRILDNNTGYVWGSSFDVTDEKLNKTWKKRVQSALWISYYHHTNVRDELKEEAITPNRESKGMVTYNPIENGFKAHIRFKESKIELDLIVKLEDGLLKVDIPYDSIIETAENSLAVIKVFPFYGAVKATEEGSLIEGYTVIPDGSGALARYGSKSSNGLMYTKNLYGRDLGFLAQKENETIFDDTKITLPVLGFVHGINRHASYIEVVNGDMYAKVLAYSSGKLTDFYWTTFEFIYRVQYQQKISQNNSIIAVQEAKNQFDIGLEYAFLSDGEANYLGIANDYHDKLASQGVFEEKKIPQNVPLHVEILNAEIEKGVLTNKSIPMTSTQDTMKIIDNLLNAGIDNLSLVLRGWSNKGYTATAPNYFGFNKATGGEKGYQELFDYLKTLDIAFYLSADYAKGFEISKGYSSMRDIAQMITNDSISGYKGDFKYYYLNPEASYRIFKDDLALYQKYGIEGICFETLADICYSNWDSDSKTTLAETLSYYQEMLALMANSASYGSNRYAYPYVDDLYSVAMYSNQGMFFTDTIPFVAYVLKDSINAYGAFMNNFSDLDDEVLRLIDFNLYPAVLLTQESTINLLDTPSNNITSAKFASWEETLKEKYQLVNDALKDTLGSKLIEREILLTGVVRNTYANGVKVYINYLNKDVNVDNMRINANSYKVGGASE